MDIVYLADRTDVIPTLARWVYQEWAYLHPDRTLADVERLILERANRVKMPLALLAFDGDTLLGTVCLKVHDMETRLDLTPWLAGLYVAAPWRHRGIGTALVLAIEKKSRQLAMEKLYLYTPDSEGFYAKLGWLIKERVEYHGYPVTIMEKQFAGDLEDKCA